MLLRYTVYGRAMRSDAKPHKGGRPPAAVTPDGKGEPTSLWPRLTLSMRPATSARLKALAATRCKSPWEVIEKALDDYTSRLHAEERKLVEKLTERHLPIEQQKLDKALLRRDRKPQKSEP